MYRSPMGGETIIALTEGGAMSQTIALVAKYCPLCGTEEQHPIPADGYMKFKCGMLVQKALPGLNECIREFLITGMCTECREETDKATAAMEDDWDESGEGAPAF